MEPAGSLPTECCRSFKILCEIISYVRHIAHGFSRVDRESMAHLDALQKLHQQLYGIAYNGEFKPKHHHRLHIPSQWLAAGVVISCEALETKHQHYKQGLADRQKGKVRNFESYSAALLPRILQRGLDTILKVGFPFWELLPPSKEGSLDDKIYFGTANLQTSQRCPD